MSWPAAHPWDLGGAGGQQQAGCTEEGVAGKALFLPSFLLCCGKAQGPEPFPCCDHLRAAGMGMRRLQILPPASLPHEQRKKVVPATS